MSLQKELSELLHYFLLIFDYLKVKFFLTFFRQNLIFIIYLQNARSFLNQKNPHFPYHFVWIMWITLCKTRFYRVFLSF